MSYKCCQKGTGARKKIKELKKDFEVLNDENRLRILCLLREHDELCVCDIYKALDLPQNLVSYHLSKLKEAGFLESRRDGVKVIYKKSNKYFEDFRSLINLII
jgi:ArsR family transcriptional regulator